MWNNKGGVGKSTITFHIASVYAEKNPDRDVIVIDMCPQANVSMMLMGGGKDAEKKLQELITQDTPKTIVGYIADKITKSNIDDINQYFTKVREINENIPSNMYLLSGDGNLELISPLLSERANIAPISTSDHPWVGVHTIIKELTLLRINQEKPCTYFIDTNPSFSIYTQMAILSANNLLVPVNADDSSIFAIYGLFNLIWGSDKEHPVYGKYTFSSKTDEFEKNFPEKISRPKVSLLIGNRFTQKKGAAHAFKALSNEAIQAMYEEYKEYPERFIKPKDEIEDRGSFEKEFSIELRDFNSAGVVAANQGIPLSRMDRYQYQVYGENIQVSKEQREHCKSTIKDLVDRID